jgi:DNA-binding response OmpR family regulator
VTPNQQLAAKDTRGARAPGSADVLLVEDDLRLARVLALSLADEGHDVVAVDTAEKARVSLTAHIPDVILLDLGLPDVDGILLCQEIRRSSDVPIIVVTARDDSRDVIAGLEAGADEYVRKPVVGDELSARIRAVLRRAAPAASGPGLLCGDLTIDLRYGTVKRLGELVPLTRTESRLLRELALNRGHPVAREELLRQVWDHEYFGDTRLLDVHVRRLRMKIERNPADPQHLCTVRGIGYRLGS